LIYWVEKKKCRSFSSC